MAEEHKVDALTGTATTGHDWDGIQELNTPLPRWWLWLFYLTIIWSVGYWLVYPAWPLLTTSTQGLFGWHAREAIVTDMQELQAKRGPMMAQLSTASVAEIEGNPQLLDFARAVGRVAFADNCAPCHGAGGGGAKGYPNLNDDDWLWGGKLADIQQTITHGVRSGDDQGRSGNMPPFNGVLKPNEISAVADYARSLSGLAPEAGADLALGKKVFADNCAVCHGPDGKGNRELGSANLTDKIWLYGSDKQTIMQGILNGRGGVMPNWGARLPEPTIKALTVYVHTLGGGEK
ncbi:cytochrome-c oxidase, cbb3-type subunit III [Pseudolabrys taiwanensis]|uniref:Cbb3-type cytochrome c oxidase subunit n=1 Tax=Pseudolabrys taiwanensis TaxID=331696 RepID=A0A346A0P9_9HYPH|nr:cytochrome-c oxidase, cbb3-type subunit III [Pseudolabrys taiwanensis]AXK82746.1 cytochrome-c oxidase, cbb3-type subunit III [Pseudolabrys taiwanensis]